MGARAAEERSGMRPQGMMARNATEELTIKRLKIENRACNARKGIPQGAPYWGADGGGAAVRRRRGWVGGLRHGAWGRGVVQATPREPPFGGRMGEGAPVRARKGVGRGREGHGDTSPRAPGAALWRRASTGGENMSLERSGGELRNAWLCA